MSAAVATTDGTFLPDDAVIDVINLKNLCAIHCVEFVAVQPRLHPQSAHGPLLLYNVPDCQHTTWSCRVVARDQAAALAASIVACRATWGRAGCGRI